MEAFVFLQAAEKAFPLRSQSFKPLSEGDLVAGGKVLIRSHVIEASGSSEAWYVPPRLFARCGLACGTVRLGAPGWAGENRGHFEHPG